MDPKGFVESAPGCHVKNGSCWTSHKMLRHLIWQIVVNAKLVFGTFATETRNLSYEAKFWF